MSKLTTSTIHAELVQEFEAALDQDALGLSEAVAAIRTLLQFIRNCKGIRYNTPSVVFQYVHACPIKECMVFDIFSQLAPYQGYVQS